MRHRLEEGIPPLIVDVSEPGTVGVSLAENPCPARHAFQSIPLIYVCSREDGHLGWHTSLDAEGRDLAAWRKRP